MKLKILTVPNPILRQKSQPVIKIDRKIKNLFLSMIQLIKEGPEKEAIGIGLSAVQVGKPIRLFVALNLPTKEYQAFINPTIIKKSTKLIKGLPQKENKYEGCLSVPGIIGLVKRHSWIVLTFQNLEGVTKTERFNGLLATVIQHEYDHLEGILLVDRLLEQKEKIYRVEKVNQVDQLVEVKLN